MKKLCLDYALDYIYHYPKTEKELGIQLMKKGYNEEDIDKTMQYLKKKKYVNDKNFTQAYIYSEVIKKGKPLIVVKNKLFYKGVDKDIVEQAIIEYENDINKGISSKIQKEINKLKDKGIDGFLIIQKLIQKGYKFDEIKKCINDN